MKRLLEMLAGCVAIAWLRVFGSRRGVILSYHSVSDADWIHAVSPDVFRAQLTTLASCVSVGSLEDLERLAQRGGDRSRRPPAAIIFDDGYADWASQAIPALREAGYTATFFIATSGYETGRFSLVTSVSHAGLEPLRVSDVGALLEAGCAIGSHSHTHLNLSGVDAGVAQDDLHRSQEILLGLVQAPIMRVSYPKGRIRPELFPMLRTLGFVSGVAGHGAVSCGTDVYALPRIPVTRDITPFRLRCKIALALVFGFVA